MKIVKPFLLTLVIVVGVGLFKVFLKEIHHVGSPTLLFFAAIAAASWLGGFRQGLTAVFLSLLFLFFVLLPLEDPLEPLSYWFFRFGIYAVEATIIAFMCARLRMSDELKRSARRDLRDAKSSLREREIAEEELRNSKSFLDLVIENIPSMIFVKEAEKLRFVRFNKAGEQLVGRSRVDLVGKSDYDFFPREQADFFIEKDRMVLASKVPVEIEEEAIMTPRGLRYLFTRKIPLFDKNGNAQYLLGISEDITEKKVAEHQRMELIQAQIARMEAEKTAQRLSFLSEASAALNESLNLECMMKVFSSVVIRHMADWCFIDFYNEKDNTIENIICAHTGTESAPQEAIECHKYANQFSTVDLKAVHGIGAVIAMKLPQLHKSFSRDLLEQTIFSEEIVEKILSKGQRSLVITPLVYHGKVLGTMTLVSKSGALLYTSWDLTILHELTKRLTLALENSRLYKNAEIANRAKSAFLANISHEIRTPLGAIMGFAELMVDNRNFQGEQAQYIMTIVRNGQQLLRLVDELLDLAKVESDKIQIEKISFSLPKLIEDVTSLLVLKAREKGLRLKIHSKGILPDFVTTDPTRLRQILINIVGNAIKFTEHGSISVAVGVEKSASGSDMLKITVVDTGIGLTPEQASRLFEPFSQADDSMTRKFGGTGLGLFLARRLARLLGGDVTLDRSELGRGSQFTIAIDIHIDNEKTAPLRERPFEQRTAWPRTHNKKGHVLVVDDACDNLVLTKALLQKMDIEADVVDSGSAAVERAFGDEYDVILMDIQMPEVDGFEAMQLLREKNYKGPVVALTAHAMKGDRERCLEAGFDDYLCKPITRQSLQSCVAKYIGPSDSPSETANAPLS